MPPRKKKAGPTKVEATVHGDKRPNIPTAELGDLVAEDEAQPEVRYPRDPSLDPQLVWKGKDDQDGEDLVVPAVPLYIQEKVDPRVIIENLRETSGGGADEPELTLFEDFDGLEEGQVLDFYEHDANWANRLILGDSLLVMTSLAEKEDLRGKVQMIYVDPPYGIKFGSNWQVSTRKRDVKDGTDASRQPEQVKAFRDTWELGIHSYLSYLRDRFVVARDLLTESGSIFVQIGEENVHLVRSLLDEVFGPENFLSIIFFLKTTAKGSRSLDSSGDYLIWFARSAERTKARHLFVSRKQSTIEDAYSMVEAADGSSRNLSKSERLGETPFDGHRFMPSSIYSDSGGDTTSGPFSFEGNDYLPLRGYYWRTNHAGLSRLAAANRLVRVGKYLRYKMYADDYPVVRVNNYWDDVRAGGFGESKVYVVQTNRDVVERCLHLATDTGDLVLDPTCGSGTTAVVAEQLGRRWITSDTSRVALALARTRLMSSRFPYYLLADSNEGARKEEELTGVAQPRDGFSHDVRKGFVCKRVPHITLASIARNENIEPGMDRDEIDRIIARDAEQELLVDQPYEDKKKVRVTGRFTVESLSPHRSIGLSDGEPAPERGSFAETVLDNLQAAGVQNTFKGERLRFDSLEAVPSDDGNLHARGTFTDADGEARTVAVCIGPEHGTVDPGLIKDAAREAVKGVGVDLLLVCGFAFEAHASETAKEFEPTSDGGFAAAAEERQYGKLRVLLVRMNPDLSMSEELLKKTGSGNLFMVFGEPDVDIERTGDGHLTVEIHGLDVYDPTTGEVRPSSTDEIACWFIDTDYDDESFYVRHAYFTGADKPYERLSKTLKADIDPEAWESLYQTKSRPFDPPESGRIAVKVINHYGDEVLQAYDVRI